MRTFTLLALLALFTVACGGEAADTAEQTSDTTETSTENETSAEYVRTAMSESPAFPGAAITDMKYENGTFTFAIDGGEDDYQLGTQTGDSEQKMCANSDKGQHIHLIVDNAPYAAKYEPTFEYKVEDGEHNVLAFISRSYHESIKHEGAAVAGVATFANGSITEMKEIEAPGVFYSRPKGTYTGKDTENIMVDFYLVNTDLTDGHQLEMNINGDATMTITEWKPFLLKGLPMGENTITLTLRDAEGNAVDGPLGSVSRTFTLAEDKTE